MTLERDRLTFDGQSVRVRFLAEGMFSRVYRETEGERRVFSLTHPDALEKEVLADVHARLAENPHLPAVRRIGTLANGMRAYVMPYYRQPADWSRVRAGVFASYEAILAATWGDIEGMPDDYREPLADVLARYEQLALPPLLGQALAELVREAMRHGERLGVEIAFRNVAFDEQGRLVLLDLLYDPELGVRLSEG